MADEQTNAISAPFPDPPPFYKFFTPENVALQQQRADGKEIVAEETPDLAYLVPPEPPASGKWTAFGTEYTTETQLRSLEENNIERLFPSSTDPSADPSADSKDESSSPRQGHAQLVIHVIRSILLNFLELVDILSQDPQVGADKIDDLQTLFFNAHHLLNEYRPHQARETLIRMMEDHISSMRADIEELNTTETKVNDMLGGLGNMSDAADLDVDTDGARRKEDEKKRQEHARLVWSAMQSSES